MRVAVVGATGAVGVELLRGLETRHFPSTSLRLFASERSRGKTMSALGKTWVCEELGPDSFRDVDLVFLDASDEVSRKWVPRALEAGAWVVDNSGAFRMDPKVPLVVPEINGRLLATPEVQISRLVSGPNCSIVHVCLALAGLKKVAPIRRVGVTTFQSVSGAGHKAVEALRLETERKLRDGEQHALHFPYPIASNCIPQIGAFDSEGNTSEESKMIQEARKILELPELRMHATAVRVAVERGHSASVNIEFESDAPVDLARIREVWGATPGMKIWDEPASRKYPTNLTAAGTDDVWVGRLRADPSVDAGVSFFVASDNLRKGAATNAIQIAEELHRLGRV